MIFGWSRWMSWKKRFRDGELRGRRRAARFLVCECGAPLRWVGGGSGARHTRFLVCRGCGLSWRVLRGFVVSDSHGIVR